MPDTELIAALAKEASRIEEDCKYSSKGHYNAAGTWTRRHLWLGIPATLCAAVTGLSVKYCPELAVALSGVAAILTGLITFLKPNERAATHKAAAGQYHALRNDARMFREIETIEGIAPSTLAAKVKDLSKRRNSLNQSSPGIPDRSFQTARKGIEEGQSDYDVDKE